MSRDNCSIFICIAALTWTSQFRPAAAADFVAPPWRGADIATYQQWNFDNADNPAAPGISHNPYGLASVAISIADSGTGWYYQLEGFGTLTGYWDLGGTGGSMVAAIPNNPLTTGRREVWVQVTYYRDISRPPTVNVRNAQAISTQTILVEHTPPFGDWYVDQLVYRLGPGPQNEPIILTANPNGTIIDAIVVDTISIVTPSYCNIPARNVDGDADVDEDDFAVFQQCAAGPEIPWPVANINCACFDNDGDGDVDQTDYAAFQRCMGTISNNPNKDCTY